MPVCPALPLAVAAGWSLRATRFSPVAEGFTMAMLNFYRQVREDGGIRTGIELNGTTIFERFESGGDDYDLALDSFSACPLKWAPMDGSMTCLPDYLEPAPLLNAGAR
jgi:hypothetical protein